jgi:hypothetical protein
MDRLGKYFSLCLVVLLVVTSTTQLTVNAQTIPKPSVPEFIAEFVPSYNTVTTTDPYSGENSTTTQNLSTIDLKITNQQYSYTNGSTFSIYYNIRIKGSFEERWTELYHPMELLSKAGYNGSNYHEYHADYIVAIDSPYYHGSLPQTEFTYTVLSLPANEYPHNGQLDIQVEAILGISSTYFQPNSPLGGLGGQYYPAIAYVTSSDWSPTQTITISAISSSVTPAPSSTNSQSSTTPTSGTNDNSISLPLSTFVAIIIVIIMLAVAVLVLTLRRHRKTANLSK